MRMAGAVAASVLFVLVLSASVREARRTGRWICPDPPSDSQDYEGIAFNLWKGRGFGFFRSDPEFRRPYEDCNASNTYAFVLGASGEYTPTTSRPPAFPWLVSLVYRLAGRSFVAVRLLNGCFVAAAAALAFLLALRLGAGWASLVVAAAALLEPDLATFGSAFLTEALAIAAVSAALAAHLHLRRHAEPGKAALCGALLGALVLVRFSFLPLLSLSLFLALPGSWETRTLPARRRLKLASVHLGAALLVAGPWMVRNCVLAGALLPTGPVGAVGLASGYSDVAVRGGGDWSPAPFLDAWKAHVHAVRSAGGPDFDGPDMAGPRRELERSRVGAATARAWALSNAGKVPGLMVKRVRLHWSRWRRTDPPFPILFLGLALLALLPRATRKVALFLWTPLVLQSVVVALTFEHAGRFHFPFVPLVWVLAALGASPVAASIGGRVFGRTAPAPTP